MGFYPAGGGGVGVVSADAVEEAQLMIGIGEGIVGAEGLEGLPLPLVGQDRCQMAAFAGVEPSMAIGKHIVGREPRLPIGLVVFAVFVPESIVGEGPTV